MQDDYFGMCLPVPGVVGLAGPAGVGSTLIPLSTPGTHGVNDAAAHFLTNCTGLGNAKMTCGKVDAVTFPRTSATDKIKVFEGYANYMYLDTKGLVTIGVGWNLESGGASSTAPTAVLALPFRVRPAGTGTAAGGGNAASRSPAETSPGPATDAEIEAAWKAIKKCPKAKLVTYYESKTNIYIDDSGPDNVLDQRFKQHISDFTSDLQGYYPGFDTFPVPAREALLDMCFNMGVGMAATAGHKATKGHKATQVHRATGLHQFVKLRTAVLSRKWRLAADSCHRGGLGKDANGRNLWTHDRFIEAVAWDFPKLA